LRTRVAIDVEADRSAAGVAEGTADDRRHRGGDAGLSGDVDVEPPERG
jgi:hypothetical protein